ncbi:ribosome maturation factor RimM [Thiohalobacter sp. IOR34]|uniref:ribosome maturation factor RimM n=1 Tax=Thiohalobacter sp. IOR34 TaxID=3057176 RepID=UPI0025B06DC8|nr:ribosome maturation factor RimM [Thiohalobacter sp. IOR34]WJW74777.1 ribosome maturation factor RimM [Thiohalobacter sp. IOR34]
MTEAGDQFIIVGRISGLYGVRGWVRVYSHTEPRENIVDYRPWYLQGAEGWQPCEVVEGRRHGKGVVARLAGYDDRTAAAALLGRDIAIRRDQLPETAEDEYYWTDLEGLEVVTTEGVELGRVDHLFATGANDVLVVRGERERLIPFVQGQVIRSIDLAAGRIEVDWDPDF